MNPYVKSIDIVDNSHLKLIFENGEQRLFDINPFLSRGVFNRLQNPALFRAARVVACSVEWPGGLDLSYDTLYIESTRIESEKAAVSA
jgi:hypothetical protein